MLTGGYSTLSYFLFRSRGRMNVFVMGNTRNARFALDKGNHCFRLLFLQRITLFSKDLQNLMERSIMLKEFVSEIRAASRIKTSCLAANAWILLYCYYEAYI